MFHCSFNVVCFSHLCALALLALVAAAFPPPQVQIVQDVTNDGSLTSVEFSLQCDRCLGLRGPADDYDALNFTLQASAQEQSCGPQSTSTFSLNGQKLEYEWDLETGWGLASIVAPGPTGPHIVAIEYFTSCFYNSAPQRENTDLGRASGQLLRVKIVSIDNRPPPSLEAGFRVLFNPNSFPEALVLDAFSEDPLEEYNALPLPSTEDPTDTVENPTSLPVPDPLEISLDDELKQLERLRAQAHDLHRQIGDTESLIRHRFGDKALPTAQAFSPCSSLKCMVSAAFRNIVGKLHHSDAPGQNIMALEQTHLNQSRTDDKYAHAASIEVDEESYDAPPRYTRLPDVDDVEDPETLPRSDSVNAFLLAFSIVSSCFGCGCLVIAAHKSKSSRKRSDASRLQVHTEQRTLRRSRKFQAISAWWRARFHKRHHLDYEEKRVLILEQEGVLEGVMQQEIQHLRDQYERHEAQAVHDEIRQLRTAHDMVGQMINAEEGRFRGSNVGRVRSDSGGSERPPSRTSSLPDYTSEAGSQRGLPAYSEYEEDAGTAADGFCSQYAPPSPSDQEQPDWTPDSSVIDVSPRQSFETLNVRYTRDESEN